MQLLLKNVLKNPYIWGMAFTYFFIYIIRQGVTSWSIFFLMKAKGVADAGTAAFLVSGLELGGLAGSLLAGRLSDHMIKNAKPGEGFVGKRVQVVLAYTIGIAGMLAAFRYATPHPLHCNHTRPETAPFWLSTDDVIRRERCCRPVIPIGCPEMSTGWLAVFGQVAA